MVLHHIFGNQEVLLDFKEKYLKEERQKVIAEFEGWIEHLHIEDIKQKLNEMKEV